MHTTPQQRTSPPIEARLLPRARQQSKQVKAAQREFFVLVGVFLGSLTLVTLAIAISAAIMLANANS
jgi:hypothetical protein